MFWAMARGRRLSAQEMQDRAQFQQRHETSTSRTQTPTSGRKINGLDSSSEALSRRTSSSPSDNQSDRMMLDDDKTSSSSKIKDSKNSSQRRKGASNQTLQQTLQTERNQAYIQYNNWAAYQNASAGRSVPR